MTCRQARQLLAAYRRDDRSPGEDADLQAHLLECAECRALADGFRHVGEALQALPEIAAPPDFYARVMAAVRAEENQAPERERVAQRKPETVVVPGMTNVAHLPALRRAVAERRARVVPLRRQMGTTSSFALRYGAALAATFLIFAVGLSLALFQLLHSPNPISSTGNTTCVSNCHPFFTSVYSSVDLTYPLVSAAAASTDGQYVIYAAHNASGQWMLEELNRQTGKSASLLSAPVAGPLTLEGWARNWLLWAQGTQGAGNHWELDATELSPALPGAASTVRLLQGNAVGQDGGVAALHGVATSGATVLLAEELTSGRGQLVSLDLSQGGAGARAIVATAHQPDHLITDPATDGTTDYWVDQWQDPDGTLHGNIVRFQPGAPDAAPQPVTTNDVSFSPMIVAGKLLWLEEPPSQDGSTQAAGQPATSPTPTATGTVTPGGGNGPASQVVGILWSESQDGRPDLDTGSKTAPLGTNTLIAAPQAGATFVVVQDSGGNFYLYDVANDHAQPLNAYINNPLALSVSPTSVLWVTADSTSSSNQPSTKTVITINVLDWPQK